MSSGTRAGTIVTISMACGRSRYSTRFHLSTDSRSWPVTVLRNDASELRMSLQAIDTMYERVDDLRSLRNRVARCKLRLEHDEREHRLLRGDDVHPR